ncbi:MAG: ABC transporter substrate-binding protein [Halarcobacter sp.]
MNFFIKLFFILILSVYAYSNPLKKVTLQLQWKYQFQFAGYIMAKEKGFYKDVGLDVTIKEWNKNVNMVDDVISGKAQYSIVRPSALIDISKGKQIILLSAIFQSSPLIILSNKDSGIKNIKDFENKRLMTTGDLSNDVSLMAMMMSQGLNVKNVTMTDPTFNVKDLLDGKADLLAAYISNEPYLLKELGGEPIIFNPKDFGFDFYNDILVTSKNYLDKNSLEVKKFKEATLKGWEYAFSNIQESINTILEKYNTQHKTKEALLYEAKELKKLSFYKTENIGKLELNKLERIYDIYRILGLVQKNINLEEYLYKDIKKKFTKDELKYLKNKKYITMCIDPAWMPFEKFEKGKHEGLTAEYFKLFSEEIGINFQVIPTKTWKESLQKAKQRECDIISLAIPTKERKKYLGFTSAYIKTPLVVVTNLDVSFINDISNLKNKKVGIPKAYNFAQILKTKYPYLNLIEVENDKDGLEKVKDNELFAYIGSLATIEYIFQKEYFDELKIAGKLNEIWELGIAVRNDDPILFNILEKTVKSLNNKQSESIVENWKSLNYQKVTDYTLVMQILIIVFILALFAFYKQFLLKKSLKEFNELFNATLEGIIITKDGICIDSNKSGLELLGLKSKDEIINRSIFDFVSTESKKTILNNLYNKNSEPYEVVLMKNDGTKFVSLVRGYILEKRNVRISSFIDITKLKNQEKLLVEQSKMMALGEMLSNIAHQWRQPLAAISAASTGMKLQKEHDMLNDEQFFEACNTINNYSQYLSKTIDDFKNYAKGDTSQIKFNLKKDTKSFLALVDSFIKKNNLDIKLISEDNIEILGYPNQLIQCMINLFYNSNDVLLNLPHDERYIEITQKEEDGFAIIEFKDNGGGISPQIKDKIFEPYFTTKHQSQGTGLGLHMSYNLIVNSMKGSISVDNVNFTYKGKNYTGALFKVVIPINQ